MRATEDKFVLRFTRADDRKQILSGGPWFYGQSQFVLAEYDGLQDCTSGVLRVSFSLPRTTVVDLAVQLACFRTPPAAGLNSVKALVVMENRPIVIPALTLTGVKRGAEMALVTMSKRGRGEVAAAKKRKVGRPRGFKNKRVRAEAVSGEAKDLEASLMSNVVIKEPVLEEVSTSPSVSSLGETSSAQGSFRRRRIT
ncbi:hypothetical protein ACLB2K_014433 [Fragaria x ananassa]